MLKIMEMYKDGLGLHQKRRLELKYLFDTAAYCGITQYPDKTTITYIQLKMVIKSCGIIMTLEDQKVLKMEMSTRARILRKSTDLYKNISDEHLPLFKYEDLLKIGDLVYTNDKVRERIKTGLMAIKRKEDNLVDVKHLKHHLWRSGTLIKLSYDEIDLFFHTFLQIGKHEAFVDLDWVIDKIMDNR